MKNSWLYRVVETYGIDKVNSLTEYPSILTYHKLGDKGGLLNELYEDNRFGKNELLEVTEKVDGTNMRLILTNEDYLVATRSNIVYAQDDRIINEKAVKPVLDECDYLIKTMQKDRMNDSVLVVFGEVYGNSICNGSKVYCSEDIPSSRKFRVFDVREFPCIDFENILEKDLQDISRFKSNSNQYWYDYDMLDAFCYEYQLERTPVLCRINEMILPTDIDETYKWMQEYKDSNSIIGVKQDGKVYNQNFGKAEGVVIRNKDRSVISKLRFEDYERTFKRRN